MPDDTASTRSVAFLTACTLGQAVVQFAFQLVLAATFGSAPQMDALVAAWTVPLVLTGGLAGALAFAFVPTHAALVVDDDSEAERRLVGDVVLLVLLGTCALSVCGLFLAEPIVRTLVPGFDPGLEADTVALLRRLIWLVPLQSLAALLRAVHQGRGRFGVIGVSGIAAGGVTLGLVLVRAESHGAAAVATALLAGAATSILILAPGSLTRMRIRPVPAAPARAFLLLLMPLLLAAVLQGGEALVDRRFASSMPAGTVAQLGYAQRLVIAVYVIGVQGLSTVVFPAFARTAARGDDPALAQSVATALRGALFVFVPMVAGLACFAAPTIRILFERNAFLPRDTAVVSSLVVAYSGMVLFGALGEVLVKAVFAWRWMWLPVGLWFLALVAGIGLRLWLTPWLGVRALAWSSSIVITMNGCALGLLIVARLGSASVAGVSTALVSGILTTIPALGVAWGILRMAGESIVGLVLAVVLAAVTYVVLNVLVGDEFATRALGRRTGES